MTYSLEKDKIKILLLENISQCAVDAFHQAGYHNIEQLNGSLNGTQLIEKLKDTRILGIRSRTHLNEFIFNNAPKLIAVGCFCIGTNQVNLTSAEHNGTAVFNAPFSNTRSVAELVIGQMILLMRNIPKKNADLHRGIWNKSASNSFEVRGKTLGIIGYGHIGSQVSVLAESLGLKVIFYDIVNRLPLGNASAVNSLDELLKHSDIVSLHVPETELTQNMINQNQLALMKDTAVLINASRGNVIEIDALYQSLKQGRFLGAAIDVFPEEPQSNQQSFNSPLIEFDRVILTPHIGGSTEEAQENIGIEVAQKLIHYSDNGSTLSAVNFPQASLPMHATACRLLHIHVNQPGMMRQINRVCSESNINILGQYLQTTATIGYVVMDIETDKHTALSLLAKLKTIDGTIRSRILY
ncbi:phosphoglycerate dehydrogenase [Thiotrichales bacterium 19S3-7]|nr:phosphoglycerate dehydrogenase [Thiotrichales bacterium 19S3-7]MCF6802097.1 phosphoglycerate dehydrogenase [Thiotrichales bacterium 19S3-11]